jgi:hypothetical protein
MMMGTMIAVAAIAGGYQLLGSCGSDARTLVGRVWIERLPRSDTDQVELVALLADEPIGVFRRQSRYEGYAAGRDGGVRRSYYWASFIPSGNHRTLDGAEPPMKEGRCPGRARVGARCSGTGDRVSAELVAGWSGIRTYTHEAFCEIGAAVHGDVERAGGVAGFAVWAEAC